MRKSVSISINVLLLIILVRTAFSQNVIVGTRPPGLPEQMREVRGLADFLNQFDPVCHLHIITQNVIFFEEASNPLRIPISIRAFPKISDIVVSSAGNATIYWDWYEDQGQLSIVTKEYKAKNDYRLNIAGHRRLCTCYYAVLLFSFTEIAVDFKFSYFGKWFNGAIASYQIVAAKYVPLDQAFQELSNLFYMETHQLKYRIGQSETIKVVNVLLDGVTEATTRLLPPIQLDNDLAKIYHHSIVECNSNLSDARVVDLGHCKKYHYFCTFHNNFTGSILPTAFNTLHDAEKFEEHTTQTCRPTYWRVRRYKESITDTMRLYRYQLKNPFIVPGNESLEFHEAVVHLLLNEDNTTSQFELSKDINYDDYQMFGADFVNDIKNSSRDWREFLGSGLGNYENKMNPEMQVLSRLRYAYSLENAGLANRYKLSSIHPSDVPWFLKSETQQMHPVKASYNIYTVKNEGYSFLTCFSQSRVKFSFYLHPFERDTWIALLTFLGFMSFLIAWWNKVFNSGNQQNRNDFNAFFFMYTTLLEYAHFIPSRLVKLQPFRIAVGLWLLLSLIFTNGYKGIAITDVMAPKPKESPFRNFWDLANNQSGLQVHAYSTLQDDQYVGWQEADHQFVFGTGMEITDNGIFITSDSKPLLNFYREIYSEAKTYSHNNPSSLDYLLFGEGSSKDKNIVRNLVDAPLEYHIPARHPNKKYSKSYDIAVEQEVVKCNIPTVYLDYKEKIDRELEYLTSNYKNLAFFKCNNNYTILDDDFVWQFDQPRGSRVPYIFRKLLESGIYEQLRWFYLNHQYLGTRLEYTRNATFGYEYRLVRGLNINSNLLTIFVLFGCGLTVSAVAFELEQAWMFLRNYVRYKLSIKTNRIFANPLSLRMASGFLDRLYVGWKLIFVSLGYQRVTSVLNNVLFSSQRLRWLKIRDIHVGSSVNVMPRFVN